MTRLSRSLIVGSVAVAVTPIPAWPADIVACELRIDGVQTFSGNCIPGDVRPQYSECECTFQLESAALSVGPHFVEVRMQGSNGKWCAWQGQWIRIGDGAHHLTACEHFIDNDPGPGNGTPVPLPKDGAWDEAQEEINMVLPSDGIAVGDHTFYLRCQDSDGNWGITNQTQFDVTKALHIVAAEWTTDPACTFGGGHAMRAADGAFDEAEEDLVDPDAVVPGDWVPGETICVYVRTKDSLGRWSTRHGYVDYVWSGNEAPGQPPGGWFCDPQMACPPETSDCCDACASAADCADSDPRTTDTCDCGCCTHTSVVSSNPPAWAIDARQPSEPDGSNPGGWDSVQITLNDACTTWSLVPGDFKVYVWPADPTPQVTNLTTTGQNVTLHFDRRMPPGYWTCVEPVWSGERICWGDLPGDVNNDRTSGPVDILAVIDCLNRTVECDIWQCDVDRSAMCAPADILRVIDLLNGADRYDEWLGRTLPVARRCARDDS